MEINLYYLENIKKQFNYYKSLGEKAIDQLDTKQLFYAGNENTNSIAVIVKHLHGNMSSRWTDFLTTDGEKTWRKRDDEFESGQETKETILKMWHNGWDCLFNAINILMPDQLTENVFIRGEKHLVIEAINRQLAHYSYHVGQIVFAAKQMKEGEWVSLSIPKRKNRTF